MPRPLLPLLTLLLLLARPAHAYLIIPPSPPTLGSLVASSSTIVRGTVSHVDGNTVTIDILETLQGIPARSLIITTDDRRPFLDPAPATNALFFFNPTAVIFTPPDPLPTLTTTFDFFNECMHRTDSPALTDDLHLLSTPDAQLAEVRRLIALQPLQVVKCHPPTTLLTSRGISLASWYDLAITPESLTLAHDWLLSPDPEAQWAGAEILARHPSSDAPALLLHFAQSLPPFAGRHTLASRAALLTLLNSWHAAPLPPLLDHAPLVTLSNALSIAALAATFLLLYFPRTLSHRVSTLLLLMLFVTLSLGICRSYPARDAFTFANTDFALERGNLYIVHNSPLPPHLPFPFLQYAAPSDLLSLRNAIDRMPTPSTAPTHFSDIADFDEGFGFPVMRPTTYADLLSPFHSGTISPPFTLLPHLSGPTYRIPLFLLLPFLVLPLTHRLYKYLRTRTAPAFPITPSCSPPA